MPCSHFAGGIITWQYAYFYKGFYFEYHPYCGPMKLKKNGDDAKRQGSKFYEVAQEWFELSKEEKKKTQIWPQEQESSEPESCCWDS